MIDVPDVWTVKGVETDEGITAINGDSLVVLGSDVLGYPQALGYAEPIFPDNSIDAIVTDPPYGLSNFTTAQVEKALLSWLSGDRSHVPNGSGFMGRDWDAFVPPPAMWDECRRVLKPGGALLCFAGTRTVDLMGTSIRLAGFEIRDSIDWVYFNGFPKSLNVATSIDKAAKGHPQGSTKGDPDSPNSGKFKTQATEGKRSATDKGQHFGAGPGSFMLEQGEKYERDLVPEAERWQGWGTALKPAHEPIIVARKPLVGTVAGNVLMYGTGALNIDGCRVATNGESFHTPQSDPAKRVGEVGTDLGISRADIDKFQAAQRESIERTAALGRWPANFLLSHLPECVEVGTAQIKAITGTNSGRGSGTKAEKSEVYGKYAGRTDMEKGAPVGLGGEDGKETVVVYDCAPGCPVAELDAQGGDRKAGGVVKGTEPSYPGQNGIYGTWDRVPNKPFKDSGGGSRFFPVFDYKEVPRGREGEASADRRYTEAGSTNFAAKPGDRRQDPGRGSGFFPVFKYQTKASSKERPVVVTEDGKKIAHPTVKPLGLMRWLIRLVTPPDGVVLDPFAGSGATGEAASMEGVHSILIERDPDSMYLIGVRQGRVSLAEPGDWEPVREPDGPVVVSEDAVPEDSSGLSPDMAALLDRCDALAEYVQIVGDSEFSTVADDLRLTLKDLLSS